MRTSTILSLFLAGGALAKPVHKALEERVLVVEHKVVTTVVWVTAGEPTPAPNPPTSVVVDSKKEAVAQGFQPHRHRHGHGSNQAAAQKAAAQQAADQQAAEQKAAEQKAAEQKAAEQKAAEQKAAEQKAAEQKAAEQKAAEQKAAEQKAAEQKAAEQQAPEQKAEVPQNQAPAQKAEKPNDQTQPVTPTQPTSSGGDVGSEGYKSAVLEHHNIHRANHSADALEWDETLAGYAEQVAKSCVYAHDRTPGGGGYGQNIAAGTPAKQVAQILTNAFYNDEMMLYPGYGSDNPDMTHFEKWGHFSQMLWGSTKKVGCYSYSCNPNTDTKTECNPATGKSYLGNVDCGPTSGTYPVFTVCNYSPPGKASSYSMTEASMLIMVTGNYAGQYSQVKAPQGKAFVSV
ncbi:MAG: hypothetical protein Q9182_001025 [Xanthomendoza sp. 2 TL-2023]